MNVLLTVGLIGLFVCLIILFVILFFVSKKDQNVTDSLVAALGDEKKNLLMKIVQKILRKEL